MSVKIKRLDAAAKGAWDAFVSSHKGGTFCHRAGWKTAVEQGAGITCPYIYAERDGAIVGIMPLTVKKHFLFGKALVSSMFAVYGGALGCDASVVAELEKTAWDIAKSMGLPVLETRDQSPSLHKDDTRWVSDNSSATFVQDLEEDAERQLLAIPRKQRAVVRKSLKNDLGTDWNGNVDTFFDLYAHSVHALGTPVFPKKLFGAFKHEFGNDVITQITLSPDGEAIASLMSFVHKDTIMPYYAGGMAKTRLYAGHDYMYFQLMLEATKRGCKRFDFGRSKIDSGPYRFKKNWGFEPVPLHYKIKTAEGHSVPNISQQTGPYAKLSAIWKKMPFPLTKAIGPHIARHLG